MKTLILLLFILPAFAACPSIGSDGAGHARWHCQSTGNPQADGAAATIFVSGSDTDGSGPGQHLQYSCGDTIILDSGATYETQLVGGVSVPWRLAAHCPVSNKVKIVGTRTAELAQGYRVQMIDIPRMVKLRVVPGSVFSDCAAICTYGTAVSGYSLDGFVLTTDHASPLSGGTISTAMLSLPTMTSQDSLAHDIEFRHILITNAEQELFGPLEDCTTIECTIRGNMLGIHIAGVNVVLEDSAVYGLGGFLPSFGGVLSAFVFDNAGTGYAVNDTFTVGIGTYPAVGVVDSIGAGGAVTGVHFTNPGWGYATGNRGGNGWPTTATSGAGSGLNLFVVAGNTTYPVTGGTNADPTVITSTGIAAKLGISPEQGTHCHNANTGKPQCTFACAYYDSPPSCMMVIVEGTPTGWDAAAGVKFAIYKTADSVSLVPPTSDSQTSISGTGTTIDTTSAPAWSGTGKIRPAGEGTKLDPVYNLVWDAAENLRIVNSYFENGDMTVFGGNGSFATSTGTVTASTFDAGTQISTVTVTNVVGDAKVGDVLMAAAPGISKWCGPTGGSSASNNCYQGGSRSGKITSISGTRPTLTFTMLPVGPMGIDLPVTVGKVAQWEGLNPTRISMIRDRIVRSPKAFKTGKGPFESKACDTCSFDGNQVDGVMFFESKNQGTASPNGPPNAAVPWTALSNTRLRNNGFWLGGRATINANDYEATVAQAKNTWFENNFFGGAAWEQQNDINSGFSHNTAAWGNPADTPLDPAITGFYYINTFSTLPCGHQSSDGIPYLDDYDKLYGQLRDNITSYGFGLTHGDAGCWPNEATAVHHNIFIKSTQSGAPDTTAINTSWPNNLPVATAAAVGSVGSGAICTAANWRECALAPSSTYKGAASDGKDPGADLLEIDDHLNGWSEAAGLIRYENLTATYEPHPAAFNLAATHAAIAFRAYGAATCTLILYTDRSRQTIHADTNTSGRQLCTRAGNLNQNGQITFVLGANAALTANTLYAYQITTGTRVMVGEFRTAAAEPTGTISVQLFDSAANNAVIQSSAAADMSSPTLGTAAVFASSLSSPTATLSGVKYYRWLKRNIGGTVLSSGPVDVAFRP